ncbi:hypothetical protein OG727_22805 [Streptomyces caniferus]|uniref:Uncharacterized protein n=1 Tax=Streptomyces caniferus TaxID=285557 RepID=A0ABZ1VPU3_9ACTN|nr:hypothetical protein [Streptomyces caniferus]
MSADRQPTSEPDYTLNCEEPHIDSGFLVPLVVPRHGCVCVRQVTWI